MSRSGSKYLGPPKRQLFWNGGDVYKENCNGVFEKVQILEMGTTWRIVRVPKEVAQAYAVEMELMFIEGVPPMVFTNAVALSKRRMV